MGISVLRRVTCKGAALGSCRSAAGAFIAVLLVWAAPAGAQSGAPPGPGSAVLIPAPPGSAQQDLQQPDHAVDPATGHNLVWDAGRKSWIDAQTGQALGFQGVLAKDGMVIPAPPPSVAKSGAKTQAKQDPNEPEHAYNSVTGQTLVWDRAQNTWIDTRSQKSVGFQGAFVASAGSAQAGEPSAAPALPGFGLGSFGFGGGDGGGQDRDRLSNRGNQQRDRISGVPRDGRRTDDRGHGGIDIPFIPIVPLQGSNAPPPEQPPISPPPQTPPNSPPVTPPIQTTEAPPHTPDQPPPHTTERPPPTITTTDKKVPGTQEKPPPLHTPGEPPPPHKPDEPPPPHTPDEPPPPHRPDEPVVFCAMIGTQIFYPITQDPLAVTDKPIAPWDPAIGGYQVLLHTGAFFQNAGDISVPSVGFGTEWNRHYVSNADFEDGGSTGYGWDFSYNKRIVAKAKRETSDGFYQEQVGENPPLFYADGLGRAQMYPALHSEYRTVKNFDSEFKAYVTTYDSPPGQFHEIERYIVLDGHEVHPFKEHPDVLQTEQIFYVLREKNGTRLVFNCRGQMIYILSRNDTHAHKIRVDLRYEGKLSPLTQNPMLSDIFDPKRRHYTVETTTIHTGKVHTNYKDQEVNEILPVPRIKSIKGMGYEVTYDYQGEPILETVTVKTGDVTRKWKYAYDGGHHLTEVRDPNAMAQGKDARAFIVNTYQGDKVKSQIFGKINTSFEYGSTVKVRTTDSVKEYELVQAGPYFVAKSQTIRPKDPKYGGPWTTKFEHNGYSQVTRLTFPRGNGVSYNYDSDNSAITEGPFRDWLDRGYVYEHDLSMGNLLSVTQFSGEKDGPSVTTSSTYEPLYNQTKTSTDIYGGKVEHDYDFDVPGRRGNPVKMTFPAVKQPEGGDVERSAETFEYNDWGQRVSADMGDGRVTKYTFNDKSGYLEKVEYPSHNYVSYKLSDRGEIMREEGTDRTIAYKRDGFGRMTEKTIDPDSAAAKSTYKYDLNGNVIETHLEVKDIFDQSAAGRVGIAPGPTVDRMVKTTYDILNRPLTETTSGGGKSVTTTYTYDRVGSLVDKTSPSMSGKGDFKTHYVYDARGKLVETTEAKGDPNAITTTITRDENGNEKQVVMSGAGVSTTETREFDGLDRVKTSTDPMGAVTSFEYNAGGKVTSIEVKGAVGPGAESTVLRRTKFDYDNYGHMIRQRRDTLVNGEEETLWFYDKNLLLDHLRAPNNGTAWFKYDLDNRVTKVIDPLQNETVTQYHSNGEAWKITQNVKEYTYSDKTGDLVERNESYDTIQRFDRLGNAVSIDGPGVHQTLFYNSAGQIRGVAIPSEGLTTYGYDGLGRRESVTKGEDTERTTYTPAGLVSEVESTLSHQTFEYDVFGRATKITDKLTGAETSIRYDGLGREIGRTDPNGTVTTRKVNTAGLTEAVTVTARAEITVTLPNGQKFSATGGALGEAYDYDAVGRIVSARGPSSEVRLTYDGLDRAVEETQARGSMEQTIERRFAADRTWREIEYPEIAGGVAVRYSLDPLGRVTQVDIDGRSLVGYDLTGLDRVARKVAANGVETRYAYNSAMQVRQIDVASSPGQTLWSSAAQYEGPHVSKLTERLISPAGGVAPRRLETSVIYDDFGRATSSTTEYYRQGKTGEEELDQTSSTYSVYKNGRVQGVADITRDNATGKIGNIRVDSFSYAPTSRVASVTTTGSANADYKDDPETVDGALKIAKGASGNVTAQEPFRYDKAGNLIYDGRFVYAYDFKSRLVRVEDTWAPYGYSEWVNFFYDALDRRIFVHPEHGEIPKRMIQYEAEWNKQDEWELYDGNRMIAEAWVNNPAAPEPLSLLARYFFGARQNERVRMDRVSETNPKSPLFTYYFHEDESGNIKLLSDNGGQPTVARNIEPAPGEALATPTRPPEDQVMVANSSVRDPYSADQTRIDTVAGIVFREDVGRPLISNRSAYIWGRDIDRLKLKESIAALHNQYFTLSVGLAALPLTAGLSAGYVGGYALLTQVLISATTSLGLSAGTAWYAHSGYTLEEGIGDFAMGAIGGMTGGVASAAAKGVVQELVFNYAANLALDTFSGVAVNGQSWKDSFTQGMISAAHSTAVGFGVARVGEGLHWLASKATSRVNATSGTMRTDDFDGAEVASARAMDSQYINSTTNRETRVRDLYLVEETIPLTKGLKTFEWQIIAELQRGTALSREIARRLLTGVLKVRFSRFTDRNAYAQWHRASPDTLHINGGVRSVDPRTGRSFGMVESPLMVASLLVHEGVHALGGGELSAHVAQAKFLRERFNDYRSRQPGIDIRQADIPPLDSGHWTLTRAWNETDFVPIALELHARGYTPGGPRAVQVTRYAAGDAWVQRQGGWADALEVDDELFRMLEGYSRQGNDRMY